MKNVSWYWGDKGSRSQMARKHTAEMAENYSEQIRESVNNSKIYSPQVVFPEVKNNGYITNIDLVKLDSVEAIMQFSEGKTAVLNFASYKNAGGMFINGSRAQEESLCHESFLYNVLREKQDYYKWNDQHKNKALYMNRAIYSPEVRFEHDGNEQYCDVITCAAPNYSAASRYANVSPGENTFALMSRIKFVLDIAANQGVETLILGAFGCGVFGQDAEEVANIFMDCLLIDFNGVFKNIYFAIPVINNNSENYDAFLQVLRDIEWGELD